MRTETTDQERIARVVATQRLIAQALESGVSARAAEDALHDPRALHHAEAENGSGALMDRTG